jgi:hypothetical protein
VLGKGDDQSRLHQGAGTKLVSRGFVRSKADKLMLVQGSGPQGDLAAQVEAELGGLSGPRPPSALCARARLYRGSLRGVRKFHPHPQRHMFEVRHLRRNLGMQLKCQETSLE